MIDTTKISSYTETFTAILLNYAPKLISAILILIVGLYVIKIINKIILKIMNQRDLEPTLSSFLVNILNWALKIILFVSFISKLGIETSSFVAVLGAAGLAVGLSLQGSLSNFAGGMLIILFKPFKVNDTIEAQGVVGTVQEIQIFVTRVLTGNNHTIFIPNGALSNGNITNLTIAGTRRIDATITVSYDTNIKKVREAILELLNNNPLILETPATAVEISLLTDSGIKLAIIPWVTIENYPEVSGNLIENCLDVLAKNNILIQPFLLEKESKI